VRGKLRRYVLGAVTDGDDDTGAIGLKTARNRAFQIKEICRRVGIR
jgi:hypothetical protein